jgi:predicted ester cyclase
MYESINAGDVDSFGDQLADDFVEHEATPTQDSGKAGTKELFKMMRAGFPDLRFSAEDVMSMGDKVVVRARVTGTNTGSFMGMAATGKGVDVQVIDILRFGDDGLVHEHWGVMDVMAMMQQLGLAPQPMPG